MEDCFAMNGNLLRYVVEQTEELCLIAIENCPNAITKLVSRMQKNILMLKLIFFKCLINKGMYKIMHKPNKMYVCSKGSYRHNTRDEPVIAFSTVNKKLIVFEFIDMLEIFNFNLAKLARVDKNITRKLHALIYIYLKRNTVLSGISSWVSIYHAGKIYRLMDNRVIECTCEPLNCPMCVTPEFIYLSKVNCFGSADDELMQNRLHEWYKDTTITFKN
jgi:hypothetical protein